MLPANLGDDLQVCPYDESHLIQKKSFQRHLIKCRENFKSSRKVACRFDKTHIVPEQELHHHLTICPSKSIMDRELQLLASDGTALTGNVVAPEIRNHLEEMDEDWSSERPIRPTNALFNKKPVIEPVEEPVKTYAPLEHEASSEKSPVAGQLSILEYAKKNFKVLSSSDRGIGCGRGAPSVQALPKFNYLGRGISSFDGPQTPGLLHVHHGQNHLLTSSVGAFNQSHPVPAPEPQSSGQTVSLEAQSLIERMAEELRKVKERQEEEKKELERRHREERERVMLNFKNGLHNGIH